MNNVQKTVVVGLSGGVDSSVSAYLLKQQGYKVIGIFLKNWDESDENCPAAQDALDARAIADQLDIPFYSFDFSKKYWDDVFEQFLAENRKGRTPNPDIWCNKYIKFRAFLDYAVELGADYVATGHYAGVRKVPCHSEERRIQSIKELPPTPSLTKEGGESQKDCTNKLSPCEGGIEGGFSNQEYEYQLVMGKDQNKDQTYFLYTLSQEQLSKAMFPLADIPKPEVRKIAEEQGLITANKKDSTGICFIGERNYRKFLEEYIDRTPGDIVWKDTGKVLTQHLGLPFYTIGQRRDLLIGGVKEAIDAPWFVIEKDFANNVLVVSQDEKYLMKDILIADNLHWCAGRPPADTFECMIRTRHRADLVSATVTVQDEQASVVFGEPVRAITPGQSVVFYLEDVCLGGGEIV